MTHMTKTWFEDGKLITQFIPPKEIYKREWAGLTDEEIAELHHEIKVRLMGTFKIKDIYRAVEAKLKEKNT